MIKRTRHIKEVTRLLRNFQVVSILGARQVGKTTLARQVAGAHRGPVTFFDLEDHIDAELLKDPMFAMLELKGLVILDEIQQQPDLYKAIRVLADRPDSKTKFIILGSTSPRLIRQSTESLAGRVAHFELPGLSQDEVPTAKMEKLWVRGQFPRSLLPRNEKDSWEWRENLVRTYLERDLPALGIQIRPEVLRRFWAMLAHYHGQIWNASEFGRSFGVTDSTVSNYLDILASTFVVRRLQPFRENLSKRQVKSPKIYISDSGLLHTLLDIKSIDQLRRHPKVGASWEGFAMDAVIQHLKANSGECYFWATHAGAELDLLVVKGDYRWGFEFKYGSYAAVTKSMHIAMEDLKLNRLDVIHAGADAYPMAKGINAVPLSELHDVLKIPRGFR